MLKKKYLIIRRYLDKLEAEGLEKASIRGLFDDFKISHQMASYYFGTKKQIQKECIREIVRSLSYTQINVLRMAFTKLPKNAIHLLSMAAADTNMQDKMVIEATEYETELEELEEEGFE